MKSINLLSTFILHLILVTLRAGSFAVSATFHYPNEDNFVAAEKVGR